MWREEADVDDYCHLIPPGYLALKKAETHFYLNWYKCAVLPSDTETEKQTNKHTSARLHADRQTHRQRQSGWNSLDSVSGFFLQV